MRLSSVLLVLVAILVCLTGVTAHAEWRATVVYAAAAAPNYDLAVGYDSSGNGLWTNRVGRGTDVTPSSNSIVAASIELNSSLGALLVGFKETGSSQQQGTARECWLLNGGSGSVLSTPGGYITAALTFGPDGNFYQAALWDAAPTLRGIWQLDPSGVFGSGPFVSNALDYQDLSFGPDGDLYATVAGGTVQKFDGTTGTLLDATFISGGTAFKGLEWRSNVLYVVEMGTGGVDGSILRYDTNGVALGAFVTAGAGGLNRPLKFAFTPDGGVLVCDYYIGDGGFVRQYDNAGSYVGNFYTGQPAGLAAWGQTYAWPMDVAVEEFTPAATNFTAYAVWSHTLGVNDEVWAVDGSGATIWTNDDQLAGDDAPLALDYNPNDGLLYVGYWETPYKYQSFRTDGSLVSTVSGLAGGVQDVEIGPDGMLYICVSGGGVDRYNPATGGKLSDFVTGTAIRIAWGPDGHLYVRDSLTTVAKYNGTTGALMDGSFITSGLTAGTHMKWYNGDLYIGDLGSGSYLVNGSIRRFDSSGTYLDDMVSPGVGGLISPQGFDFTPDGGIIVADYYGGSGVALAFRRYDSSGASLGDYTDDVPTGAWGDPPTGWAQDIVINETVPLATNFTAYGIWSHTINVFDETWAFDASGATIWTNWDQIAGDHAPLAIDYNSNDDMVYVCYWDGDRYQSFQTDGTLVGTVGLGGAAQDIEVGPDGKLYICISGQGVDRYNPATGLKEADFVTNTAVRIAWGPDGHLYVRDSSTTVSKYHGSTGALLDGSFITSGLTKGTHMKWYNGDLYIADIGGGGWGDLDGSVRRFDSSGTYLDDLVAPGVGGLLSPQGFDFTPDGGIIVADYYGGSGVPLAFRRYDSFGASLGDFNVDAPAGAWGDPPTGWAQDIVVKVISTATGSVFLIK